MIPDLPNPPIDEVVVGLVLDPPLGPDAVQAGAYLARRGERFARHEIHEPVLSEPGIVIGPEGPLRIWLISADDAWLVQLQPDRFVANWRRRGVARYPGFTRRGGAMEFALDELARYQAFCAEIHEQSPRPVAFEVVKIDLLVRGRHWTDASDAAHLLPVLAGVHACMIGADVNTVVRWQEPCEGGTLAVSIVPARMKADEATLAYRTEFRFSGAITEPLRDHLIHANRMLNEAFARVVSQTEVGRFV